MKRKALFLVIFLLIMAVLTACQAQMNSPEVMVNAHKSAAKAGFMKAHFIDVGQGDAILVQLSSGKNILIDAGEDSAPVISYLRQNQVSRLDIIIATHPHSDHIGGMSDVIQSFDIGSFYMPRVSHTTDAFSNMLDAVAGKGLKAKAAKAGVTLDVGSGFKACFLAPGASSYEDLNNYSAVLKIEYGQTAFLFAGDAESVSEEEMFHSGMNLQADLLKVGHHGSHDSSTDAFLKAVKPKVAVISVGTGNDYGHPSAETIVRLKSAGAEVYRTDHLGTIIATSDGSKVTVNKTSADIQTSGSKSSSAAAVTAVSSSGQYIGNKSSKKFHLTTCSSLPAEKNRVYFNNREEAVRQGYSPCSNCRP